jgi:hypothetical protein
MPTTDPVIVPIQGKDNLTPITKKATMSLREMGEKVSSIGVRFTAAFTLPIVMGVKSLISYGAESSKTLADLNKAIGDANASHDPVKIKAAWDAWNGLSPAVREAGIAYDRLQEALKPVNAEFDKAKTSLLTALVPILKEITPLLISIAQWVSNTTKQFSLLPIGVQNTIIGFLGVLAAIGPVLVIGGQLLNMIGTIQMLLPGLSAGLGTLSVASIAAAAPVLALVAAVGALIYLINSGEAAKAWGTLQQLVGIGMLKTGIINEQQFIAGSERAGFLSPSPAGAGAGNIVVNNYQQPMNKDEISRFLAAVMPQVNRQMGR